MRIIDCTARIAPSPLSSLGGEGWGEGAAHENHNASAMPHAASPNPLPHCQRWGRGLIAILFLAFTFSAHAVDPLPFKDRAQEVRFQQLAKQLRCLVCQNQDLADSDADLAKDLRKQVFEMMQSGKSDDEIKQYLVARYNDFVLYDPPLKPGTWLLWFAPFALVAAGALVVVRILRRRSRLPLAASDPSTADSEEDW